jgi:hypothetical protein
VGGRRFDLDEDRRIILERSLVVADSPAVVRFDRPNVSFHRLRGPVELDEACWRFLEAAGHGDRSLADVFDSVRSPEFNWADALGIARRLEAERVIRLEVSDDAARMVSSGLLA